MFHHVATWAQKLHQDESGPTAVEYAVLLALIIVVSMVTVTALGNNTRRTFTNVSGKLQSNSTNASTTAIQVSRSVTVSS